MLEIVPNDQPMPWFYLIKCPQFTLDWNSLSGKLENIQHDKKYYSKTYIFI